MTAIFEGVSIALSSIRANKTRAALTILGVAIGVMVVMVMASLVRGVTLAVTSEIEQLGPRTLMVVRFFRAGVVIEGDGEEPAWWRNPPISPEEADRIAALPAIDFVVVDEDGSATVEADGETLSSVPVQGRGTEWLRVMGGDVYPGRTFTTVEERSAARVAVINERMAQELFGLRDPIGRQIKLSGVPFEVIGVYDPPPDLFGQGNFPVAVVPHATHAKHVASFRGWAKLLVQPRPEYTVQEAIDIVISTMRGMRGLRPSEENNFAIITQDKILERFNSITGLFFLGMIALSAVGLLVGGIGVVAVMMISVTERTREIGVRKALGATRREILWQFLVEASTLTLVGGAIGMIAGGAIAAAVKIATPLPASVPLGAIAAALVAAALTGIVFGLVPARRAAQLDPIDALRYE